MKFIINHLAFGLTLVFLLTLLFAVQQAQCERGPEEIEAHHLQIIKAGGKAGLEEPCSTSEDCLADVPNSGCYDIGDGSGNTLCFCSPFYVPSTDNSTCLPYVGLGESCKEPQQCEWEVRHATCDAVELVCRCADGYVESQERPGIRCVQIVEEIGGECDEDVQCTVGLGNGSECKGELCQCRDGYFDVGGECKRGLELGELCSSDEECQLGVNNHTACLPDPENQDEYKCACIPEAVQQGDTCVRTRVGDTCSDNSDCSRGIAGEVECEPCMDICWCAAGHMPSENWTKCVPMVCHAGKSFWEMVA